MPALTAHFVVVMPACQSMLAPLGATMMPYRRARGYRLSGLPEKRQC